ncbi:hypothetical protein AQUCO_02500046v1 [Aquilegia coerulea]|uniref:4-coumarate--CoA ligase n=1 Tax=Aquilegia coerulea TaxID=218851 RepID=A0A2G5DA21_AQUCA|nr:hypothetical protein AQUCO_02500046v1 [Aquilegia coerulea]
MEVSVESGFCSSTGNYSSKWNSPVLPQTPHLSLPSFLFSQLSPDALLKPAFIDAKSGKSISYGELRSLTNTVAHVLHSLGIKKGDVVLVVAPNFLHYPLLVLGVMSVGAIFSTANPLHTRLELQYQIQDTNPKLILTTQTLKSKLDEGMGSRPLLILLEELMDSLLHNPQHYPTFNVIINQDDIAALMYSSGTTGKSKSVVCLHRNFISMSCSLRHVWEAEDGAFNDIYLCVLPLFHMFGLSLFVCGTLAIQSTTVVLNKYSLEDMLVSVEKYKVTRLPVVPPMVVQLVRLQDGVKGYDLSSVKEVMCSGAPLGRVHMERFSKCYPQMRLSQCYGLTETCGPITLCNGFSGMVHESIGGLTPHIEAKIVDVRTGKPLPPLECGELYVRGPSVMKGYFKDPIATSLAIDKEGWLQTGDLCFIDMLGLVYIVDRIKELIKYKAYQVAPAELEEILLAHPEISEVAVIPYPDEGAGEIPMACIVKKGISEIEEECIISFVANKVAPYKKIRKVVFVDSIPRSASGKILRRHLKAKALTTHQQLQISSKL